MPGPLVPTRVQTVVTNHTSTASINQAITVTNAGDTLILSVMARGVTTGYATTAVSGAGATWFRLASAVNATAGPGAVDIWAGINATAGAQTVAITINGTQTAGCNLDEWRYVSNNALVANYLLANTATGSSTAPSLAITPDSLNEVIYVATSTQSAGTAFPGAPWTTLPGPTSSGAAVAGLAYQVTTTLAAQTATWTMATGLWVVVGVVLYPQQGPGDMIWNDPTASTNPAVLSQQSAPDMLDFVNEVMATSGTGVLLGCAVGPNTGADFNWQMAAGTAMFNWNPIPVSAVSAQAITAAASNPRKDLVYLDASGAAHYLAGVAAVAPCLPNPASFPYVTLAEIDVPANATVHDNGTSTANAHTTDKRVFVGPSQSLADFNAAPQVSGVPVCETFSRRFAANTNILTSGTLALHAIWLPAGMPVGHIGFFSSSTAASTPTHCWFGLWDSARRQLCLTADQTTTAWATLTERTLAIASSMYSSSATSFVTPYSGLYYVGIMVAASTVPSILGILGSPVGLSIKVPILAGNSSTGLTTPPAYTGVPATAINAPLAGASILYAYVSR